MLTINETLLRNTVILQSLNYIISHICAEVIVCHIIAFTGLN